MCYGCWDILIWTLSVFMLKIATGWFRTFRIKRSLYWIGTITFRSVTLVPVKLIFYPILVMFHHGFNEREAAKKDINCPPCCWGFITICRKAQTRQKESEFETKLCSVHHNSKKAMDGEKIRAWPDRHCTCESFARYVSSAAFYLKLKHKWYLVIICNTNNI